MEKDAELLLRVAANHLFLGQLEPLRAILLSLHRRRPDLAVSFIRETLSRCGRFDCQLFSNSCKSPAHLVWLSSTVLLETGAPGIDPEAIKLRAEFVLLVQHICSKLSEETDPNPVNILNKLLELGFNRLRREVADDRELVEEIHSVTDDEFRVLWQSFVDYAEIFNALCTNIERQLQWPEPDDYNRELIAKNEDFSCSTEEEADILSRLQQNVQAAHLNAITEKLKDEDVIGAAEHFRFLCLNDKLDVSELRLALRSFIKTIWPRSNCYGEAWHAFRKKISVMYAEILSSGSVQLVQMIQAIHDEMISEELDQNKGSDASTIPVPLKKYLNSLTSSCNEEASRATTISSCLRDLYHFARISRSHILECVMDSCLSAVRMENIQEASDVLSLFPLLQPLVAVLGWDLLSGKTEARRKLMELLWTSKSQELRLEELSVYGKNFDEISCVEYLCDLLCYHLDLAFFVACVNSGRPWNPKFSLFSPQKEKEVNESFKESLDPFVENFVLERLTVQTPLRVLFDLVPEIKFQDAVDLINMQPISSSRAALRRVQDVELMHMRYALETAVFALGAMEHFVGNENDNQFHVAVWSLKKLQSHLEAINSFPRKVLLVSIITSLLHMDEVSVDVRAYEDYCAGEQLGLSGSCSAGDRKGVIFFTWELLDTLRQNLPARGLPELEQMPNEGMHTAVRKALEWRVYNANHLIDEWEWRLSIMQRLEPMSGRSWSWKEALAVLRAAPSKLLNLCMQRAKYDIGEEAVHHFSLSVEDKAALELAEWVASASKRASVEDAVSRVAESTPNEVRNVDFSALRAQLGSLPAILLCLDVATTSAKSVGMCKLLLDQASNMLSEIYPGAPPKIDSGYWDQIQEVAVISVIKRILQRLNDIWDQGKAPILQEYLTEEMTSDASNEPLRQGQKQRALVILHQMIEDAHRGKRQFLSGKLHNLARVLADEDADNSYFRDEGLHSDKKVIVNSEKGVFLGLGFKALKQANPESNTEPGSYAVKDSGIKFLGPLTTKPSTYLSSFIIYIATIGDIVDGVDTTHDFNFFSLVYEWPKDLLTRLVFGSGSTDAAEKVADLMGVDFVHEVISACVPPVLPPRSGHGWACIPVVPTFSRSSESNVYFAKASSSGSLPTSQGNPLYPLELDIVKHLAKISPVRAVLACVFGSSLLCSGSGSSTSSNVIDAFGQTADAERLFYEFSLDQSERFPTLNRWIQMQSNLHRVSESTLVASNEVSEGKSETKLSIKRSREPDSDTEPEVDDLIVNGHITSMFPHNMEDHLTSDFRQNSPKAETIDLDQKEYLSFDWENEVPYEKAVDRLIEEGKLMDALALSDRCLRNGASDRLLQLLIERGEENTPTSGHPHYGARNVGSNTWQFCLRLKDKRLAAELALKYMHCWELDAAMEVLTMCSCHLPPTDQISDEVLQKRQALRRYSHILCADDRYSSWQEVETDCKEDPEGLALRLAGKGFVSAALEVAESACLSIDLRRELQGRQLVKLLTTDPLSGGGPAEASRFLSTLRDSDDALPVAVGAMQLLSDLRSKQLLVHFFLRRRVGSLSDAEIARLNTWAMGLQVLALLPLPSQQRCSALHEYPHLIVEVLLMMKQLQSASLVLKEFPSLRDDSMILSYAAKAIAVNMSSPPRAPRVSVSRSRVKPNTKASTPRSIFTQSISNLQKEARRAFSWNPREAGGRSASKDVHRKRKSSAYMSSDKVGSGGMSSIQEEHVPVYTTDGHERVQFASVPEEWVLTGEVNKDTTVRASHRYETSPDIALFKALLSLCSDESVSAKGSLELCVNQMKNVLSSQHLTLHASMETIGRAYHATETYVQALAYAKGEFKKFARNIDISSNSERNRDTDDASTDTGSSSTSSQYTDEWSDLLTQADVWLGRAELLQSLLGSGIVASLDDIADKESSARLRDRLIEDERYSMAVYTCKKCKIDAYPAWSAWGHALIRMEHYAQAHVKFKQALQLYKGNSTAIILEIINAVESGPPADVAAVRSMYDHLAKSASTILDDSLSADAYLNVLYMPSTFPRSERSRRCGEGPNSESASSNLEFEDGPRSNLDHVRYMECIHYLQEYVRPQMLPFMFRHGHYAEACLLFFPPDSVPSPPQPSSHGVVTPSSSPQRPDPLATDYGTIDDLCDLCVGYGAMEILESVISARNASSELQEPAVKQHTAASLARICSYCETHRHFNYLYKFQVLKEDHVAAGLCSIQLFMNSSSLEEAIKHLEHAKVHFEEGLAARYRASEFTRMLSKTARGKSAPGKLSQEDLVSLKTRAALQVDVVKAFNTEGSQWKYSLFGNPNDPETSRRRYEIAESLAEKHFDLTFQIISEFGLPEVDIYAAVAASLADRKRGSQLTEFLKNIKGTTKEDDWDQVLGAAINVYANKHKERPDRLIDMLISSHRKVLACVVCGRLKTAFQIASRSGSVADVQYVAHQALHANALPVLDMCKQWLAKYM